MSPQEMVNKFSDCTKEEELLCVVLEILGKQLASEKEIIREPSPEDKMLRAAAQTIAKARIL